jgi:arsenate reductase
MGLCIVNIGTASAQDARVPRDSQTVVFVCEHGTVKSVLALAYFEKTSRERGLPFRAVSRGTSPDAALPPFMRAGLERDGFSLGHFNPTRFGEHDLASAIIVSFDQPGVATFVAGRTRTVAWDNLPSVTANYAVARDSIKGRVARLVDSLARARGR